MTHEQIGRDGRFQEHPEYVELKPVLEKYRDLYLGGEEFKKNAPLYLMRRQKEPGEVYGERLDRVFYENYIGSIIDWYAATLFRREPQIAIDGTGWRGRDFFNELLDDCDLRGTNLTEFFREQMTNALVYGRSYTLVDFPRLGMTPTTRAEEDASGGARELHASGLSELELRRPRAL